MSDYKDKPELELKTLGSFFTEYKSIYDTDPEMSKKSLNSIGKYFGRVLFHETFLFWFPTYFERYLETIDTLLMKDKFLPITWRFYIALMVRKIKDEFNTLRQHQR